MTDHRPIQWPVEHYHKNARFRAMVDAIEAFLADNGGDFDMQRAIRFARKRLEVRQQMKESGITAESLAGILTANRADQP
jgi:hypothetical protein